MVCASPARAVAYPAGELKIDGITVRCGNIPFVFDENMPDVGMQGYGLILLNPKELEGLPVALQLWWIGHECGHFMVGTDESAADCWSVQTGRIEGWFPADMFELLESMFAENPGDDEHLPGPDRVRNMRACYYSERTSGPATGLR